MSLLDHSAIYDNLLDMLAKNANAEQLLAFQLPQPLQMCLNTLPEKNREGTLTSEEMAALDTYERFEHLFRLLKISVLRKQGDTPSPISSTIRQAGNDHENYSSRRWQ